jgi:signal transduction histidine kinase
MPVIAPPLERGAHRRRYRLVMLWVAVAVASYTAMLASPGWVTIAVCVTWFGLGIVAVGWDARRGGDALEAAERRAQESRSLLERQERFILDASHELRTPATIARGHLELLRRNVGPVPELEVALDELTRMDAILEQLLVLARADQPDFVVTADVEVEPLLEDVFMRWTEVAPRAWRLGPVAHGRLAADVDRLRTALDALLENAVKYSEPRTAIELRAVYQGDGWLAIEIEDEGCGVPEAALERIFDRFARADPARTRSAGGVGLGLAIVDTIAKAHGGTSTVASARKGSIFALCLPGFRRTATLMAPAAPPRDDRGLQAEPVVEPVVESLAQPLAEASPGGRP